MKKMLLCYTSALLFLAVVAGGLLLRQPPAPPPADLLAEPILAEAVVDYEGVPFCGRSESITEEQRGGFQPRPWPVKRIAWTVETAGYSGGIKAAELREAFNRAWGSWAQHADIEPTYVEDRKLAHVVSKFGDIDGSGKVLAWSELSDGTQTQKHQLYDRNERWSLSNPSGQVLLQNVAAHEIGHVLGLVHDTADADALMRPTYSAALAAPKARDVQRLIALGYKPRPANPTPPPSADSWLDVPARVRAEEAIKGLERAGYKVTK